MEQIIGFIIGVVVGLLSGVGLGMFVSWGSLERYYTLLMGVDNMLKDFKDEGHGDKWLK